MLGTLAVRTEIAHGFFLTASAYALVYKSSIFPDKHCRESKTKERRERLAPSPTLFATHSMGSERPHYTVHGNAHAMRQWSYQVVGCVRCVCLA